MEYRPIKSGNKSQGRKIIANEVLKAMKYKL